MEPARRVLVIDDDDALRTAFARGLARDGYTVQVASTAEDGLRQVQQLRPDAILLDLKMPMINGAGFLYRLRENPANRDLPVAVITGAVALDDATMDDLRMLGAKVFYKPLTLDGMRRVVQTLLEPDPSEAGPTR